MIKAKIIVKLIILATFISIENPVHPEHAT